MTSPDNRNLSILLIVEDRLLGGDLAVTLEQYGYGVTLTAVKAALAPGFSASHDLVVVDLAVEETDPLEAGKRLGRRLRRPVVYLVDDDDQASRVGEQAAGAPVVMWPFAPHALDAALQQALFDTRTKLPS